MGSRAGSCSVDPWLLGQACDQLDAMKADGADVPDAAYLLAQDMCHMVGQGVSPGIVAEHAAELARRI